MKLGELLDTIPEVLSIYMFTAFVVTFGIAGVEHWTHAQAVYWAVVTLTTTGYGDVAPVTAPGRWMAVLLMIFAWVMNLLLGAQLAAKLIVNSDAFTHVEQEELKSGVRAILAKLETTDGPE